MKRRWLWLGGPIVLAHAGCIASPALAVALGLPAVMPICGGGVSLALTALAPASMHFAATMTVATGIAIVARHFASRCPRVPMALRVLRSSRRSRGANPQSSDFP